MLNLHSQPTAFIKLGWHGILRRLASISVMKTLSRVSEIPLEPPAEQTRSKEISPDLLVYSPLDWQFKEESAFDFQDLDLILLSANHRTGSTLLQRICNSRKGTLIWGEHGGLLRHFAKIFWSAAHFSLESQQQREVYFGQGENPNLWIADMSPDLDYARRAVIDSARAFLHTFYSQYRDTHDILGFKEVFYDRNELELLCKCYPNAQFLFLVRNPLDTWKSTPSDWYPSLDDWITKWLHKVYSFLEYEEKNGHCRLLRYEDLIRQDKNVMDILGEVAKVSRQQISMVMANKIGSMNNGISESDRETILERCRKPMEILGYLSS
jgi:hypothetical protein